MADEKTDLPVPEESDSSDLMNGMAGDLDST